MRSIRLKPAMTGLSIVILPLIAALIAAGAQTPIPQQSSPVKVVKEFWKVETTGGRMTPEGWSKGSAFFIRSGLPPGNETINVVRNGGADKIEETARTATWAEVSISTDILGQIDSSLQFRSSPKQGTAGVMLIKGPVLEFDLVLTDRQWKLKQDGARGNESILPPQWLITCGGEDAWLDLDAAIAYVQERAKTTDPVLQRNAAKTLRQLRRLE
jgi:hypothetical protein